MKKNRSEWFERLIEIMKRFHLTQVSPILMRDQKALLIIIKQTFASRKMSKALDYNFRKKLSVSCENYHVFREIFTVSQNIHKLEYMLSTVNSIYSIFHIKLIMNILLNICLWKKSMGTLALDLLTRSMVLNWCQFQSQNRTENIFFFLFTWEINSWAENW